MHCGLAGGRTSLWIGLTLLGSFAAIYHPVGIPWLVRTATGARGRVIGINGVFGNAGVAAAGAVAGVLIDVAGWRAAFLVPGVICLVLGVAMVYCIAAGRLPAETHEPAVATPVRSARDRSRVFRTLFVTMICGALVYQAAQAALPKLLALRVASGDGGGTLGVGMLMGLVYGVASLSQVVAGHLADRHSWKLIYASAFAVQVPLLWLIAPAAGAPFVVLATLVVICNTAGLPAENLLLSQSASRHRQGLAFGAKFVVSFGATPAAIWLVSLMSSTAGGFASLFLVLSAVAGGGALAAALLPAGGGTAVSPAPASEAAAANVP
jgi:MFS family permease